MPSQMRWAGLPFWLPNDFHLPAPVVAVCVSRITCAHTTRPSLNPLLKDSPDRRLFLVRRLTDVPVVPFTPPTMLFSVLPSNSTRFRLGLTQAMPSVLSAYSSAKRRSPWDCVAWDVVQSDAVARQHSGGSGLPRRRSRSDNEQTALRRRENAHIPGCAQDVNELYQAFHLPAAGSCHTFGPVCGHPHIISTTTHLVRRTI